MSASTHSRDTDQDLTIQALTARVGVMDDDVQAMRAEVRDLRLEVLSNVARVAGLARTLAGLVTLGIINVAQGCL